MIFNEELDVSFSVK